MRLEISAPAKLNLTLEVLGRRADGYHEIASVMHTLSLCDTLTLELPDVPIIDVERGAIVLVDPRSQPLPPSASEECRASPTRWERGSGDEGGAIPLDTRNLIWKAVDVFVRSVPHPPPIARHAGEGSLFSPSPTRWERGSGGEGSTTKQAGGGYAWRAFLVKRIPTQAGLGGGSSDAAATLKALAEWARRVNLSVPDLNAVAVQLGADVAFLLDGGCALAQGKGEQITPLPPLPPFWWVIAKPYGVSVPTAWAYTLLKRGELASNACAPHTERLVNALRRGTIQTPAELAPLLYNDFDTPILDALPELQGLRQKLYEAGALKVVLCGSGAAQAALCQSQAQAERVAEALTQQGYWAVAIQTTENIQEIGSSYSGTRKGILL